MLSALMLGQFHERIVCAAIVSDASHILATFMAALLSHLQDWPCVHGNRCLSKQMPARSSKL
jgi:hypothetical protein